MLIKSRTLRIYLATKPKGTRLVTLQNLESMSYGDFINRENIEKQRQLNEVLFGKEAVDLASTNPYVNAALSLIGTRCMLLVCFLAVFRMCFHLIAFMFWKKFAPEYHLLIFLGISGVAAWFFTSLKLRKGVRAHSVIWNFARANQASAPLALALERAVGRGYELMVYSTFAMFLVSGVFVVCLLANSFSLLRVVIALGVVYVEMKVLLFTRLRIYSTRWQAAISNLQPVALTDQSLQYVASAITGRKAPILGKSVTGRPLFSPNLNGVSCLLFAKPLIAATALWLYWNIMPLKAVFSSKWLSSFVWLVGAIVATNLFALLVRLGWRFMQYTRDNSCNVVVFWRFEDKVGRLARGTMTPLLSLVGMVFIVSSKYFAKQSLIEKFAERSWMQPFAFPWLSPRMNVELEELEFHNASWKPGVTKLVSEADVVLVLLTDPSENVLWEIEESLHHVPPRHILIICAKSKRSLIAKVIHEKMPSLTAADGGLCFIQYGDHLLGRQLLKLRVCFRLRRLVRNRCEESEEPVLAEVKS